MKNLGWQGLGSLATLELATLWPLKSDGVSDFYPDFSLKSFPAVDGRHFIPPAFPSAARKLSRTRSFVFPVHHNLCQESSDVSEPLELPIGADGEKLRSLLALGSQLFA